MIDLDVICIQLAYGLCHLFSGTNFQVKVASLLPLCHHVPIHLFLPPLIPFPRFRIHTYKKGGGKENSGQGELDDRHLESLQSILRMTPEWGGTLRKLTGPPAPRPCLASKSVSPAPKQIHSPSPFSLAFILLTMFRSMSRSPVLLTVDLLTE